MIVTTAANATLAPVHDRMPVMLTRAAQEAWLDPTTTAAAIEDLAAHGPSVEAWAVGTAVNDPRNDDERVIVPQPQVG